MSRSAKTKTSTKSDSASRSRRGNGEGCIYQRANGTWAGQILVGYKPDGKPIRKCFSGKTRKEVATKMSATSIQVLQGTHMAQPSAMTVKDFADYWLGIKRLEVTSRTLAWNRDLLESHVLPMLGPIPLANLTCVQIQTVINAMAASGSYSHRTIKAVRDLINQMLKFACRQKLIQANPVECVVITKKERTAGEQTKAIPIDQRTAVLNAVKDDAIMKPIITTFLLSGMRPSELLALTWSKVDMPRRLITVDQALTLEYDYDRAGNPRGRHSKVGPPKTDAGYRKILVPQAVVNALKEWQVYLTTLPKGPEMLRPESPVFCSTVTGTFRTYNGFHSSYRNFLARHNLNSDGLSLHRYRHTYATTLLEMGINPRVVQKLLGHRDISTTLETYSHVVNEVYENVAAGLDVTYQQLLDGTYVPALGMEAVATVASQINIGDEE